MEALKPCPFCGEKSDLSIRSLCGVVVCTVCSAEGPCRGTKKEIIAAWNTRIDPQRKQLVKALKDSRNLLEGLTEAKFSNSGLRDILYSGLRDILYAQVQADNAALTAAGEQL